MPVIFASCADICVEAFSKFQSSIFEETLAQGYIFCINQGQKIKASLAKVGEVLGSFSLARWVSYSTLQEWLQFLVKRFLILKKQMLDNFDTNYWIEQLKKMSLVFQMGKIVKYDLEKGYWYQRKQLQNSFQTIKSRKYFSQETFMVFNMQVFVLAEFSKILTRFMPLVSDSKTLWKY